MLKKISIYLYAIAIIIAAISKSINGYGVVQYSIFASASAVLILDILVHKRSLKKKNFFIMSIFFFITIILQEVSFFKFGFNVRDLNSFLAAYIFPTMILLMMYFNNKDFDTFYRIVFYSWSLCEIVLIFFYIKEVGFTDNFISVVTLRKIFPIWPNYFAMLSAVKIGLGFLNNKKTFKKLGILLSILIIILSQSRTASIMMILIFIPSVIIKRKYSYKKYKVEFYILIGSTILLTFFATKDVFFHKGETQNNTIKHTLSSREERWDLIEYQIKHNFVLGNGFRSTTDFIEQNTGVNIGSAHNDYIDLILKGGIIYFIVFYFIVIYTLVLKIKKCEYYDLLIILSILLAGLTQNPFKFYSIQIILASLISKSLTYSSKTKFKKNCINKEELLNGRANRMLSRKVE